MSKEDSYHEYTDHKAHKEYIRSECFDLALKRHPDKSITEITEAAKEIEKYIFDRVAAPVVKLVPAKKKKKKGKK